MLGGRGCSGRLPRQTSSKGQGGAAAASTMAAAAAMGAPEGRRSYSVGSCGEERDDRGLQLPEWADEGALPLEPAGGGVPLY